MIDGAADKCLEIVEKIYNHGYDIKEFYRAIMDQYRNLIVCLVAPGSDLLDVTEDNFKQLEAQAKKAGLEKLQQSLNILINREETLRYTSHTRLVLETIIIKVCQLGDFESFKEIIGMLHDLEKRLSPGTPAPYQVVSPGAIAEEQAVWDRKEETPSEDTEEREDLPPGDQWKNFMGYLASKNPAMSNGLKEWKCRGFKNGSIELLRGESAFSSVYLDDEERIEKLTNYCREYFKSDIKIKISGNAAPSRSDKAVAAKKKETPKQQYADMPRQVQDVLDIFKGEIKG